MASLSVIKQCMNVRVLQLKISFFPCRFYYSVDGKKLPREMEAAMTSEDGGESFKDQMRRAMAASRLPSGIKSQVDGINSTHDVTNTSYVGKEANPNNPTNTGIIEPAVSDSTTSQ